MNKSVDIRVFTDPTCPFAYSSEQSRWRLKWLYGNQLNWEFKMIVLSSDTSDNDKKHFTPDKQAKAFERLRAKYGMPIDASERPRVTVSVTACLAYVAVRINQPDRADKFLRALRIAFMSGDLIDDMEVIKKVAEECQIDTAKLEEWMSQSEVRSELDDDMALSRNPTKVALTLPDKLSYMDDDEYRYSAPSYQIFKDDEICFELPGYWAASDYELAISNVYPELTKQPDPDQVVEVLEWAGEPLATAEVAAIMNKTVDEVRPALEKRANFKPLGQDGFWSL